MHGWTGWTRRTLPSAALVLGACVTPPEQLGSGSGSADGTSTTDQPPTTAPSTTTPGGDTPSDDMGTLGGSGMATTESADTTAGVTTDGETTMSVDPTNGSSSSGPPPPECMGPDDCENNEDCVGGQCVSACDGSWGMGNYDYCLTPLGTFDSATICGQANTCLTGANPIEFAVCGIDCATRCDCPAPPATGTATVSCTDFITGDGGAAECYLSCENGETCPDDMICRNNFYCTHPVQPLAMYGNCDDVDASCINGECATASNGVTTWSVCVSLCPGGVGECDSAPPGATMGEDCGLVISPPDGPDCHLDCTNDGDCPTGMVCISFGGTPTMCMWP